MLVLQLLQSVISIIRSIFTFINLFGAFTALSILTIGPYVLPKPYFGDVLIKVICTLVSFSLFALSCMGIYASIHNQKNMMAIYALSFLFVLALELSVAVPLFIFVDIDILDIIWQILYVISQDTLLATEKTFECCGYENFQDRVVPKYCVAWLGYSQGCAAPLNRLFYKEGRHFMLLLAYIFSYQILVAVLSSLIFLFYYYKESILPPQNVNNNSPPIYNYSRNYTFNIAAQPPNPNQPLIYSKSGSLPPPSYSAV